jgi:hypothetical protein
VGAFAPGRFTNAIQRTTFAHHARQVVREDGTSSFVLDLGADGAATLRRGYRYAFFNDGPTTHTHEHLREQLGYRGRWEPQDGWVHLHLELDDGVCPRVGEYTNLIPNHTPRWHLRCVPIVPAGHPLLDAPALACRALHGDPPYETPDFGEDEPHTVPGVLPGRWIVLGVGYGLRFRVDAHSVGGGEPPDVRVARSAAPVPLDTWERSFTF